MAKAHQIVCPQCHAAVKSIRGVRVGRPMTCPQCQAAFLVAADGLASSDSGELSTSRLSIALGGMLVYLLGGVALAYYCFERNTHNPDPRSIEAPAQQQPVVEKEPTLSPLRQTVRPTVTVPVAEQRQIDDAIAKGVWWLKDHLLPTGTWGESVNGADWPGVAIGFASLPGLTLLECGVPGDDPVIQKAAAYVRAHALMPTGTYDTYERALAILFLDRLGDSKDEPLIQNLALCLITGQRVDDGGWGYHCPSLEQDRTAELLGKLRQQEMSLVDWRSAALKGGDFEPGRSDNSNSQFAILGLWAARRHKVPIERTMARVDQRFRSTQRPKGTDPGGHSIDLDGSWDYSPAEGTINVSPWPNMTCAGLLGLAVANGLAAEAATKDPNMEARANGIHRALGMLGREIDRPGEGRAIDMYFLWSLERVGVLYNLEKIENKDWYAWGRKLILPKQQPEGCWKDCGCWYASNPVIDTSFALLFLKQANLAPDLSDKLRLLGKK